MEAMADEPTLPRLPAVSWNAETQSFTNTRKRARNPLDPPPLQFNNSSDPAVFSSDDDPHVDNYVQGRHKKKRYVGTWFQQQPASSDSTFGDDGPRPPAMGGKRTFERTVDSGVWMGSDDSVDLEDGGSVFDIAQPMEPRLPQLRRLAVPTTTISHMEEVVKERIDKAIEEGVEDVDLTTLGLETVSSSTIARLSDVSYIPFVTEGVPFEHKDPSLRIYLANNPLRKAPGSLFNLEFLTVLSLRNAKITEIPPSIGRLHNLQTLNLSLNRIRSLPGELLDLMAYPGKLSELTISPNPFHRPSKQPKSTVDRGCWENDGAESSLLQIAETEEHATRVWASVPIPASMAREFIPQSSHVSGWHVRLLARSPVQFSDSRGSTISGFRLPTSAVDVDVGKQSGTVVETQDMSETPRALASSSKASRVHSLLEVALRSCSRAVQIQELPSYLPEDAPAHLTPLLRRIVEQSEDNDSFGDLPCSVCKQRVIVPVTQWIEWYSLSRVEATDGAVQERSLAFDAEETVPFLRRGCSWGCVPEPKQPGSGYPGTLRWETRPKEEWL